MVIVPGVVFLRPSCRGHRRLGTLRVHACGVRATEDKVFQDGRSERCNPNSLGPPPRFRV